MLGNLSQHRLIRLVLLLALSITSVLNAIFFNVEWLGFGVMLIVSILLAVTFYDTGRLYKRWKTSK